MSRPLLYGPCRELGYCDCGGKLGCVDDEVIEAIEGENPKPNSRETAREDGDRERLVAAYAEKLSEDWDKEQDTDGRMFDYCENCHVRITKNHNCVSFQFERARREPKPACPDCGVKMRSNHRCKAARLQSAPGASTEKPAGESTQILRMPAKARITIEVGDVRITIGGM